MFARDCVFEPLLEQARGNGRRLRVLFELGPDFEGFTAGGAWEDAKIGLRYTRLFDACAIVTDLAWILESTKPRTLNHAVPRSGRLRSVPEGTAIGFRLLAESGVIVVEVKEALRAHDFDALALTADAWIEALWPPSAHPFSNTLRARGGRKVVFRNPDRSPKSRSSPGYL